MDILKNPFHILGVTPQDNKLRIMELAEEKSLLSDADECMTARSILIIPSRRISAELAWLPGINQILINGFLNLLERSTEFRMELFHKLIAFMENINETGYEQTLFGKEKLIPLSHANLFAAGLFRVYDYLLDDIVQWNSYTFRSSPPTTIQWILEIAKAFDKIKVKELCMIINEERRESGFPEITNLSTIEDELHNRRHHYGQVINLGLKDLPLRELAAAVTIGIKTATNNGKKHGPILIEDLVFWYENHIQEPLENVKLKIILHIEDIRVMADTNRSDSSLDFMINELIRTVQEDWNVLVQPIRLSKKSRGERYNASFEIAERLEILAADLFGKYGKFDFAWKIINTLKEVFTEVPELAEHISEFAEALEEQKKGVEKFKEINRQIEKLKEAADTQEAHYTLAPIVNQLIQTLKTWEPSIQPIEANEVVAFAVRNIALHLWNEHKKLDFAIQMTETLIRIFKGVKGLTEVNNRLSEDITTLYKMRKFEEITSQVEKLKEASNAYKPDYTLAPMVRQLIETVKTWHPYTQSVEENNAIAFTVRSIALYLCNEHKKFDFAIQITNALIGVFQGVNEMEEVNKRLSEDLITLYSIKGKVIIEEYTIKEPGKRTGTSCLLQIAIFVVLALIGVLLQGC